MILESAGTGAPVSAPNTVARYRPLEGRPECVSQPVTETREKLAGEVLTPPHGTENRRRLRQSRRKRVAAAFLMILRISLLRPARREAHQQGRCAAPDSS